MTIRKIAIRILAFIFLAPLTGLLLIYLNYHIITIVVRNQIYSNIDEIPFHEYTLTFGTGSYRPEKWTNHGLLHRMSAVEELIVSKKTKTVILSGRKQSENEDETADMKLILNEMGVDSSILLIDTAGTRTWESVKNAKNLIKDDNIIFVSQIEQLERALFIANWTSLNAIGYKANPLPYKHRYWTIREYLARVKCTYECIKYKFTGY